MGNFEIARHDLEGVACQFSWKHQRCPNALRTNIKPSHIGPIVNDLMLKHVDEPMRVGHLDLRENPQQIHARVSADCVSVARGHATEAPFHPRNVRTKDTHEQAEQLPPATSELSLSHWIGAPIWDCS